MDLIKLLAAKLGCKETESSVLEATTDLADFHREAIVKLGAVNSSGTTRVCLKRIDDLVAAIGNTIEMVVDSKKERDALAHDLDMVMPELRRLKKFEEDREDAELERDVGRVMRVRGYGPELRTALTLYREYAPAKFAELVKPCRRKKGRR